MVDSEGSHASLAIGKIRQPLFRSSFLSRLSLLTGQQGAKSYGAFPVITGVGMYERYGQEKGAIHTAGLQIEEAVP